MESSPGTILRVATWGYNLKPLSCVLRRLSSSRTFERNVSVPYGSAVTNERFFFTNEIFFLLSFLFLTAFFDLIFISFTDSQKMIYYQMALEQNWRHYHKSSTRSVHDNTRYTTFSLSTEYHMLKFCVFSHV